MNRMLKSNWCSAGRRGHGPGRDVRTDQEVEERIERPPTAPPRWRPSARSGGAPVAARVTADRRSHPRCSGPSRDHLQEAAHVADRLHRTAVAVQVARARRARSTARVLTRPGVMNENLMMLWASWVRSTEPRRRRCWRWALTPYSGTLIPRVGMAKVWPTPLPALELISVNALPLRVSTPPMVPCTIPTAGCAAGCPSRTGRWSR